MKAYVESITETPDHYQVTVGSSGIESGTVTFNVDRDVYQKLHKQGIEGNNEVEITLTVLDPIDF